MTKLSPLLTEPRFGQYLSPMYNKTKNWQGVEAVIGRIPMASLVDEHSGRPLIGTAKPAIMGQLPTGNSNLLTLGQNQVGSVSRKTQPTWSLVTHMDSLRRPLTFFINMVSYRQLGKLFPLGLGYH